MIGHERQSMKAVILALVFHLSPFNINWSTALPLYYNKDPKNEN
jgi:hypothetical protein